MAIIVSSYLDSSAEQEDDEAPSPTVTWQSSRLSWQTAARTPWVPSRVRFTASSGGKMKVKSAASIVGIAAAIVLGLGGTAHANQPPNVLHPGAEFVGSYPTEKKCWAAAADEMGRDPSRINYSCALTPQVRWDLWMW
ncbi:hypothetical protein [Nocardia brasiliensis]|uniref:hypothetical protein n=1 Tax=Nocardia brasiliensis TaxID=37326 RepID=UPI003D8FEEE6